jgi:hypothetical protein
VPAFEPPALRAWPAQRNRPQGSRSCRRHGRLRRHARAGAVAVHRSAVHEPAAGPQRAVVPARADAMGLLEEGEQGHTLDASSFSRRSGTPGARAARARSAALSVSIPMRPGCPVFQRRASNVGPRHRTCGSTDEINARRTYGQHRAINRRRRPDRTAYNQWTQFEELPCFPPEPRRSRRDGEEEATMTPG